MAGNQIFQMGVKSDPMAPGTSNISGDRAPAIANMGNRSTTTNVYDPNTQNFINQLLGKAMENASAGKSFGVADYTKSALETITTNPGDTGDIAGRQFQQIAAPMLEAQQAGFKLQQQNVSDMFRKAGMGTQQSGAFAQAGRQMAADQGRQQQQLIASNYVPLLSEANKTVMGGINAGLAMPGAEAAGQAPETANQQNLSNILGTLYNRPMTTSTTGVKQELVPGSAASMGTAR